MNENIRVAIVRGKFLNHYEMQTFEPLAQTYDITAFGSITSFHDTFAFPTVKLLSPMDVKNFPKKMPILNRLFIDAHYLFDLEHHLKNFELVHTAETYFTYTQQCLNAKKKGLVKKVIATVLENIPFNNEGILGRQSYKERARLELDHIIALSEKAREAQLLEGADPEKITVIGYGIDTKRFLPKKIQHTKKKKFNILYVGRLEREKGVYEILFAAKRLLGDKAIHSYELHFTFCGSGSQKYMLTGLIKRLHLDKHVSFITSSYDEIPYVYKSADIFLAPSKEAIYWQEQFSIALLEAQASGLPIITTFSGSIPENVGNAAVLIPPGDFVALSEKIKSFILEQKKMKYFADIARSRAEQVYDIQIVSKKIKNVYERVLNA